MKAKIVRIDPRYNEKKWGEYIGKVFPIVEQRDDDYVVPDDCVVLYIEDIEGGRRLFLKSEVEIIDEN